MRDFRDRAGQRVDTAYLAGEATIVNKNGTRRAVLVPYDWYTAALEAVIRHEEELTALAERQQERQGRCPENRADQCIDCGGVPACELSKQ